MHGYLADGFYEQWLAHSALLQGELPGDALLHPGHGGAAEPDLLAWQVDYIRTFVDAVRRADWSEPGSPRQRSSRRSPASSPASSCASRWSSASSPWPRGSGLAQGTAQPSREAT